MVPRHPQLLDASRSRLVVIDVQERFVPAMDAIDPVLANIEHLAASAADCDVPVVATEQVPSKLGATIPPLRNLLPEPFQKSAFSAAAAIESDDDGRRDQIVICGIEAHVCVLQTAFDALAAGLSPVVVSDAITSRTPASKTAAVARLLWAGIDVATTEMILFEWLAGADHPAFREVSRRIR